MSDIKSMVSAMIEEGQCADELGKVRSNLFKTQFTDAFCYGTEGPEEYWNDLEAAYKEATDGQPIPTRYRTNKSVILKAWEFNPRINTYYKDSSCTTIFGKSHIDKMVKSKKPKSDDARAKIIRIMDCEWTLSGEDGAAMHVMLEDIVGYAHAKYGVEL